MGREGRYPHTPQETKVLAKALSIAAADFCMLGRAFIRPYKPAFFFR